MRGEVVIETDNEFQAWLEEQPTFAQSLAEIENGPGSDTATVSSEADVAVLSEADVGAAKMEIAR